jgi:hypothetical protein
VTFLPFLMSWTRTHFRMAELGCLASTPTWKSQHGLGDTGSDTDTDTTKW